MVAAITTNPSAYTTPANPLNPETIWETMLDLFTFNMDDYPLSDVMKIVASLMITIVMYSALLAIAAHNPKLLIIVAIIALIQTVISILSNISFENVDWTSWIPWA